MGYGQNKEFHVSTLFQDAMQHSVSFLRLITECAGKFCVARGKLQTFLYLLMTWYPRENVCWCWDPMRPDAEIVNISENYW